MLQDNPLLAQLKQQLHAQTPRIEGIIRAHEKGYGFLETDNKKSYFIPASKMKKVLPGDKVSGTVVANNDKESFEPESLVTSSFDCFLGQINFENKSMVILPEKNSGNIAIRCKASNDLQTKLKAGDWVKAKLTTHPLKEGENAFSAEIIQFIAEENNPYLLWLITLAQYDFETNPPQGKEFILQDDENVDRIDLTDKDFFTIDSQETQDMDDALFITQDSDNYHLSIAIADPTAYILPESELDEHAKIQHFSTYLPSFTVPMLPKSLANGICSLKAGEKRAALICQVTINQQGHLLEPIEFYTAWIISKAKLSYANVSDFLGNELGGDDNRHLDSTILQSEVTSIPYQLKLLSKLTELRLNWRNDHALLFKDNPDYRFIFDENRKVIDITQEPRRIAHKMVEESMVIANQALTQKLSSHIGFGIFNCHNGFDPKYIDSAVKVLNDFGISDFDNEVLQTFEGYKKLRKTIENDQLLEYRLRRFQSPADFSLEPKPHFAMGFNAYATWTSPLRKYGDMTNHRLIKMLLTQQQPQRPNDDILLAMNEKRKLLRFAERNIAEKLYAQFLLDKVGQAYQAELIDINRGGAKVRLTQIGAVGFMPLSLMHTIRQEIVSIPDEGVIKIKEDIAFKLLDKIDIIINEVKIDNQSIIVKLAP